MKKTLFILLTFCLCLPLFISCRVGLQYELVLTVADTMPSCVAIEDECFYGYDDSGSLWKIYWDETDTMREGDVYLVRASRVKDVVYPDGYPSGWNPKYEGSATHVDLCAPSEFVYANKETASLTLHSAKHINNLFEAHGWTVNSPSEIRVDEYNCTRLLEILDRQKWLSLSKGIQSIDATLDITRVLVSEKDDSTPLVAGESADLKYIFDLEKGKVLMTYASYNTDMWDRQCVLSAEDLAAVIDVIVYYKAQTVSAD